jgi:hypothetical protein
MPPTPGARRRRLGGVRVQVKVDATKATEEFQRARRDVDKRLRIGLRTAGEKVALPEARRRAPVKTGRLRSSLTVKSRARDAVLTTSLTGKRARYVGLLEYGGTVRTTIEPKRKQAVVVNGQPVARVTESAHLPRPALPQRRRRRQAPRDRAGAARRDPEGVRRLRDQLMPAPSTVIVPLADALKRCSRASTSRPP